MRIQLVALMYISCTILASERIPIAGISPSKKYYQIEALNAEKIPQSFLLPIELIQYSESFKDIPVHFSEKTGVNAEDAIQAHIKSDIASYEGLWFFFNHLVKNYHLFCEKKRPIYAVELARQFESLPHEDLQAEQILLSDFFMINELKKLLTLCKKTIDEKQGDKPVHEAGANVLSLIPARSFDKTSIAFKEKKLEGMEVIKFHENGTKFLMKPHQALGILHEAWQAFTSIRILDESNNHVLSLEGTFYEKDHVNALPACILSANKKSALLLAQNHQIAHPMPQILLLEEGALQARLENAQIEAYDWAPSSEHFMRIIKGHQRHHILEIYHKSGDILASHECMLPIEKRIDTTWSPDGRHLYLQEKGRCNAYTSDGILASSYQHAPASHSLSKYLRTHNKLLSIIVPEKTNNPPQICIFDQKEKLLMSIDGPRELNGCKASQLLLDDAEQHIAIPFYKNKSTSYVWLLELPIAYQDALKQSLYETNNILSARWAPLHSTFLITSLGKKKYSVELLQDDPPVILCTGQDAVKDAVIDVTGNHIFIPVKAGSSWLLQHYIRTYLAHEYGFGNEKFLDVHYHQNSNTITCFSRSLSSKQRIARIFSPEHPDTITLDCFTSAKDIHAYSNGIIFRDNHIIKEIDLTALKEKESSIAELLCVQEQ